MRLYLLALLLGLSACAAPTTAPQATLAPSETPAPAQATAPVGPEAATEIELALIQQASQIMSCNSGVAVSPDVFGFICDAGAGHSTTAQLTRYADPVLAQAAFDAERSGNPVQCFHGYPAAAWDYSADVGKHRLHVWLASNWLVEADAFDDTGLPSAPDPLDVSEAVYTVAEVNGFLPAVEAGSACQ